MSRTLRCAACLLFVAVGGASGQQILFELTGADPFDGFGAAVHTAGDLNQDGVPDVLVGAPGWSLAGPASGGARVFSGADGAPLLTLAGAAPFDRFGWSVASAGDVDGDGRSDLAVGAFLADAAFANSGAVTVHSAATGETLATFGGSAPGDSLGIAIAAAGDVDGDGVADLLLGASGTDTAGGDHAGSAEVRSSLVGPPLFKWYGHLEQDEFGAAVAGAGDVDGDGFADLIVGAWGAQIARVYSGQSGALLKQYDGESHYDYFGISVAGAGDVNADGLDEVVIGAPFDALKLSNHGTARVYSVLRDREIEVVYGLASGDQLGWTVAGAGDVDGDGHHDFAAGAIKSRYVLLISGRTGQLIERTDGDAGYGWAIASGGDLDQDGHPDLLVSTSTLDPGSGKVSVLRGCGSTFQEVAEGCAPDGAASPSLVVEGCARAGDRITVRVKGVPPQSVAWLVIGPDVESAVGTGCRLTVVPPQLVIGLPNPASHYGDVVGVSEVPSLAQAVPIAAQAATVTKAGLSTSNRVVATLIP